MIYRPDNFILQELVSPRIYKKHGEAAWNLLDEPAVLALQRIWTKFGRIKINDWHKGGKFDSSGLRDLDDPEGAKNSAHKIGPNDTPRGFGAFDIKPLDRPLREVYDYVLAHPEEFPEIRRVEDIRFTPTWMHFDTKTHPGAGIRVFKP